MSKTKGNIACKRFCCVEWSIENFSDIKLSVHNIWCSPTFHLWGLPWIFRIFLNDHLHISDICLYLVKLKSERKNRKLSFHLGVEANNNRQYISYDRTRRFGDADGDSRGGLLFKRENGILFWRDKTTSFPDTITCFCEVFVGEETVDVETQTSLLDGCAYLTRDLKELFLNQEGADVTIKVKDKEFRAHSQILSARSSVFAPMFKHDTKEKNTGVVDIPDYEPDVFREFLIFLYSGQAEKLSSYNNIDLYCAADKYDLKELKAICSEFMHENITLDSFCDALSLAIRYRDKDLMDFLTVYFIKNVKEIIVTLKWMSFAKEHPIESNELFIKLAHHFLPV